MKSEAPRANRSPPRTTKLSRMAKGATALLGCYAALAEARPGRRQGAPPQIDFTNQPLNNRKAIALTFDDGPDNEGVTRSIVDFLVSKQLPATFFMNTDNYNDVATDPNAQAVVRYVHDHHFTIGDHTVHHYDLTTLSDAQVVSEIRGVENTLRTVLDDKSLRLTLFRAPYGSPYDGGSAAQLARIAPIVAERAVEIGWAIDSGDSTVCTTATCVENNVLGAVDAGNWGIVLMHATHSWTLDALPNVVAGLQARGCEFISVEDVVWAQYGQTSDQLFGVTNDGGNFGGDDATPRA